MQYEEKFLLLCPTNSQLLSGFSILILEKLGQFKFWIVVIVCLKVDSKHVLENLHLLDHFDENPKIDFRLLVLDVFLLTVQFEHVASFFV